ncbi:TRAP transporter small permease [Aidingimonas lacisalsi]|uniref:TRAP transporter small permease n=1 Tax=Aidingimonas lacisalsi TaxID=2604086 RepID=UPI001F1EF732|nr:TRAP transporter small permease [Aidingimonas lacisalsi]
MTFSTLTTRTVERAWQLLTGIVMTAFALMLTIMAIQVISRYVLGIAVPWTDEASRYLFLAEIFLGSILALHHQEHIRITVLVDILPPAMRRIAASVADVICIIVLVMLVVGAWNMMGRTAGILASTFNLSFSYIYFIQGLSALIMIGLLAGNLYRRLNGRSD